MTEYPLGTILYDCTGGFWYVNDLGDDPSHTYRKDSFIIGDKWLVVGFIDDCYLLYSLSEDVEAVFEKSYLNVCFSSKKP